MNHSNVSKDYKYPQQKRNFTGKTYVSQAVPSQSTIKTKPNQGTENHFSTIRPKKFNSFATKRSYKSKKVPKPTTPKSNVKSVWVIKGSTEGQKSVLSVNKGKIGNYGENIKKELAPQTKVLDHVLRESGKCILKEFQYVTPLGEHKSVMAWVPKRN